MRQQQKTENKKTKKKDELIVIFLSKLLQVLNKGKIIAAERIDVTDQLITSVGLVVTPEMMPSFRFVAFYTIPWTAREEVVSDSIWIDVADSCAGGVRVFFRSLKSLNHSHKET